MANPYPYKRYGMIDTPTALGGGVAFRPSAPPGSMQGVPTQAAMDYLQFIELQRRKREEEAIRQGLITNPELGNISMSGTGYPLDPAPDDPISLLHESADMGKVDHMLGAAMAALGGQEAQASETPMAPPQVQDTAGPSPADIRNSMNEAVRKEFADKRAAAEQHPANIAQMAGGIKDAAMGFGGLLEGPSMNDIGAAWTNWVAERDAAEQADSTSFEQVSNNIETPEEKERRIIDEVYRAMRKNAGMPPEEGSTFRGMEHYAVGPSLGMREARRGEGEEGPMYPDTMGPAIAEADQGSTVSKDAILGASEQNLSKPDSNASDVSPTNIDDVANKSVTELVDDAVPWEARDFLGKDIQAQKKRYLSALNDIFGKAMILNIVANMTGSTSNAQAFIDIAMKKLDAVQDFDGKQRLQDIGRLVFFNEDGTYNPPESRRAAFDRAKAVGANDAEAKTISGMPAISSTGTTAARKKLSLVSEAKRKLAIALRNLQASATPANIQAVREAEAELNTIEILIGTKDKATANQIRDDMRHTYDGSIGKPNTQFGSGPDVNGVEVPPFFMGMWGLGEDAVDSQGNPIPGIATMRDAKGVYYLIGDDPNSTIRVDSYPLLLEKMDKLIRPTGGLAENAAKLLAFEAAVRQSHPTATEAQIQATVDAYKKQENL